jgi:hypothetical protein
MGKTKIVLDLQSDLILNNALIVRPSGIVKSDLPGLVDDINGLTMSIASEASARAAADQQLSNDLSDLQNYVDTTVDSAIATLTSDLADEAAARITADAGLDGRINDIISNTNAPIIDSFAEVVAQMEAMPGVDESSIVVDSENNISLKDTVAAPASGIRTFGGLVNVGSEPSLDENFVNLSLVTKGYVTGLVDAEEAARIADVDAEEARALAAETALSATFSAALAAETFRAQAAEIQLSNDLSDETSYRIDADTLLQSNIDVEKGRIDAILLASDADKDNFAEIVTLINSVDTENDQAFASYVLSNNAALSSLSATFSAALSAEEAARIADVDAEEARALAAEAALSSDLADLQSYVDTTVDSAISTLTSDLADETSARIADVDAEEARALAAEGVLQTNINTEEAARIAADSTLQVNIDSETSRAQIAETAISADLVTETNRATTAETLLQSNIDVEKGRIDAILLASDADKDNFAEIVTLINSVDTENDQAFASYVLSNNATLSSLSATFSAALSAEEAARIADVDAEEARALAAELVLTNDLATETARATNQENILTAALTTEIARAYDAEGVLQSNINAEVTRATTAETLLQTNINTEANERMAEDITLQGNIDIEASRAQIAETAIAADLATEIADRIAAVSSEETRAMLAEAALSATFSAAISTEETRAIAAEGVLQSNIDVEKSRIDSILLASDADKDSFAEIVQLINSVDTTNDQAFASYVLSNDAALAAEVLRAETSEAALSATFSAAISTEEARATVAELVLTNDLATEVSRATAAESALTAALSAEEASRIAGDSALQASLNNEIADRIAAGQSAQSALDSETARAQAAEGVLTSDLSSEVSRALAAEAALSATFSAALSAETFRAQAAEVQLQNDLSDETSYRIDADIVLQSNIDVEKGRIDAILLASDADKDSFAEIVSLINSVDTENDQAFASYVLSNNAALSSLSATFSAALSTEEAARIADVDAEEARALAAEALLQAAIDAETAARIAADAGLDGRINDIISNTNAPIIDSFAEVVAQMESMPGVDDSSIVVSENNISLKDTVAAPASGIRTFNGLVNVGSEPSLDDNFVDLSLVTKGYVTGLVDAEESARIADVDAEEARATNAENILNAALSTEIARAYEAEGVLQSNIDVEKGRIDAILDGSDVNLDQFREVVAFVESIDLENDNSLLSAVTQINSDIDTEEAARIAADAQLTSDLASEISRATAAEEALDAAKLNLAGGTMSGNIDMGTNNITNAEIIETVNLGVSNSAEITHVGTDRLYSKSSSTINLSDNLDAQNTASIINLPAPTADGDAANKLYVDSADAALQSNIDTEKARIDAILAGSDVDLDQFAEVVTFVQSIDLSNDDALLNAVISIEDSISDEAAERQAADSAIEDSISSLESNINSELSTLSNSLNTEIENRISDIETIETSISDLTETLDIAVLTINDSIDAVIASVAEEHAHHTAAEVTLQSNIDVEKGRIDAILQGSDVNLDQFMEVVDFVNSIDLENDEALMNAIIGVENSIDDEISDREAADLAIQDTISSLESTLSSNISTLTTSIDTEISDRISAIESIEDEISDLTDSLDATILTINDSINGVISDLDAEVVRATAAETTLQANIDTEKGRIDAILLGSDVNLDQFVEIVDFVNSIDLTNDDALLNAVIGIEDSISDEAAERQAADSAIEDTISSLESNISSELSTLTNSLNTEIENRISDIETVESNIADLTETVDTAIIEINDSIDAVIASVAEEHAHHTATEVTLQANIDTEKARIDAILDGSDVNLDQFREVVDFVNSIDLENDEALMNAIIGIENSIDDEISDREAADLAIQDTISSLESTLSSNISTLTSSLDQEIADRISAIESIEDEISDLTVSLDSSVLTINDSIDDVILDLDAEVIRATAAEGVLQANIDVEKSRIDAILQGSDVDLDQFAEIVSFVQSIDLTNDEALLNAVIAIEDSVTDEATERQAADLAIEDTISSLESNINSELSTLTGALNTEIGNRISDIETVESAIVDLTETLDTAVLTINDSIAAEVAARIADVDAEESRALSAEAALDAAKLNLAGGTMSGNIDMGGSYITNADYFQVNIIEVNDLTSYNNADINLNVNLDAQNTARIIRLPAPTDDWDAANKLYVDTADILLQSNIDVEKSRIDAILQGSDVDLDQFAEVVTFVQSIDMANDDAILTAVTNINSAIDAETAARIADVDAEEARALAAETALATDLAAEIVERESQISSLSMSKLDLVGGTMEGSINMGGNGLIQVGGFEVFEGAFIDMNGSPVHNVAAPTNGGDATNKTYVDTGDAALAADLADETAARIADVDAEEARALAAEAALSATFSTAISAEVSRATAAEGVLQSNIDVEKGRIDAILLASDADKDSFAEIVTLINSVDTENDTAFASYVLSNNAALASLSSTFSDALAAEIARATAIESMLSEDLSAETDARISVDAILQSNINAEVSRATTAEETLQTNINTEANERMAEDITLQGNIDIEATRAQGAETAIAADLATEITDRIAAVSAEETRAMLAEAALSATFSAALSTEVTRATAAEGVLQSNIDVEKYRIDAILIGASASADNFAEIVQLINSVDTTNDQAFASYVLSNDAALSSEVSRAIAAETALSATFSAALSTEVSRATAAELVLTNDLATEVSRATAAEAALTAALSAEETSRIAGDAALQSSLNNEISDRLAADQALQSALDSESTRALAAEAALTATFSAALAAEVFRATAAEVQLQNELSDETSYRIDADTLLQSNIDVEKSRIDAILIGASASADNFAEIVQLINSVDIENDTVFAGYVLSNNAALATEVSRALAAEASLSATFSAAISAEVSRATAAEAQLAADFANIYCKKVSVSGTPNGVLTSFTLASPVRLGSEMIYINGLLMTEGDDYTTVITSGKVSAIEFLVAPVTDMRVGAYGVYGHSMYS